MRQQSDHIRAQLLKEQQQLYEELNKVRQKRYQEAVNDVEHDVRELADKQGKLITG
jgi:hypothetical protein